MQTFHEKSMVRHITASGQEYKDFIAPIEKKVEFSFSGYSGYSNFLNFSPIEKGPFTFQIDLGEQCVKFDALIDGLSRSPNEIYRIELRVVGEINHTTNIQTLTAIETMSIFEIMEHVQKRLIQGE